GLEDDFAFIKASNFAAEHGCHMTRAPKEIVYTKWDREVERWEMTSARSSPNPSLHRRREDTHAAFYLRAPLGLRRPARNRFCPSSGARPCSLRRSRDHYRRWRHGERQGARRRAK